MDFQIVEVTSHNLGSFAQYLSIQLSERLNEAIILGAVSEDHSLGAIACLPDKREEGVICEIVSLYVDRELRRQKIGTQLVREMDAACARMFPNYLYLKADYIIPAAAHSFIEKLTPFWKKSSRAHYYIRSAALHEHEKWKKAFSSDFSEDEHIRPISSLDRVAIAGLQGDPAYEKWIDPVGRKSPIIRQASVAWMPDIRSKQVDGYLIVRQNKAREIVFCAMSYEKIEQEDAAEQMLFSVLSRAQLVYGRKFDIYFSADDPLLVDTMSRLMPDLIEEYTHGVMTGVAMNRAAEEEEGAK